MGEYGGVSALPFWKGIIGLQSTSEPLAYLTILVPVAAMLLALPAGESHDEYVFSAAGRIYSDDRNAMSPARLEQLTVIVMYLRSGGWSQEKLNKWVQTALETNKHNKVAAEAAADANVAAASSPVAVGATPVAGTLQ